MHDLPENLYSAAQVRSMDRHAIDTSGVSAYTLMTRAGDAAVEQIRQRWATETTWVAICGGGNNAGDALVVARRGIETGQRVHAIFVGEPGGLKGAAKQALDDYLAAGGVLASYDGKVPEGVLIDGLLGTGLCRDVHGAFADAIGLLNNSSQPVLALDLPSGLSADTGRVMGVAVRADATISFVGLKAGLFLGDGPDYAGDISFSDLGVGASGPREDAVLKLSGPSQLERFLPRRSRVSHKGAFGHVLVIGGGPGMPGAARLCAEAALRSGAGLVTVATHPDHAAGVSQRPELICHGVRGPEDLDALLDHATVVALGPGLGAGDWAGPLCEKAMASGRAMVVDADGLNWLSKNPARRDHWILTPHPGEAARLLESNTGAVQRDRIGAVRRLQERFDGVAVLKGAGTLCFGGTGVPSLCRFGNPGMASAGMGDVLTGVIAGLFAQTGDAEGSARFGVLVHALAGDDAAGDGERGLVAGDLMRGIRRRVNPA